jgi:hypothetical protein
MHTIPAITAYTGKPDSTPTIAATYHPATGWTTATWAKRASASWLRKLQAEGITHVSLLISVRPRRTADFSTRELLRSVRQAKKAAAVAA